MTGTARSVVLAALVAAVAVAGAATRAAPAAPPGAPAPPAATAPTAPKRSSAFRVITDPIPELDQVLAGFSRRWTLAQVRDGHLEFVTGCGDPDWLEIKTDQDGRVTIVWDFGESAEYLAVVAAERVDGAKPRVQLSVTSATRESGLSEIELVHLDRAAGTARWTVVEGPLRLPATGVWVGEDARSRYPVRQVPCGKNWE